MLAEEKNQKHGILARILALFYTLFSFFMALLPEGAVLPQKTSQYMKFQEGKNRFRILELPVCPFFEAWRTFGDGSRKPVRAKTIKEFENLEWDKLTEQGKPARPKNVWAIKVFRYFNAEKILEGGQIEILSLSQVGIIESIIGLDASEDWKDLTSYDLTVSKNGKGMESKYTVQTNLPKPLENLGEIMEEAKKINLEKLISNEDPFSS